MGSAARVSRHGWRARVEDTRVIAAILCLTWGLMFVVQRLALEESPPLWVAAGRSGIAALVLLPWAGRLRALSRRGIRTVIVLGLLNQFLFIGLQAAGLKTVGAGPAAAIIYLQPVLVVVASGPVLGERLTPRRIVAALLGFAGVAVVGLHQSVEASAGGVLLLLGASVSWSAGALITSASDEPIVALVVGQHFVGAPLLVTVAAISEPFPTLSAKLVSCLLFAGVCGSAMAWMLWSLLLRRGEASVVSTWLFAVPMLAAVLGVVFLDEPLSLALIIGIALVAVAVRLAAAPSRDRERAPVVAGSSRPR
jgi:drug/metabolite transporter (DMT)-like permease